MIPADHVGKGIITMRLRILCIMSLEESPIREGNRFEIILRKHHLSLWYNSGVCPSMG